MPPDLAFLARHPFLRRFLAPAVAVMAFFAFVILTFPYDTLARRIEVEARRSGAELTIGSLGPAGLLGVRGRDVKLKLAAQGENPPLEIHLDRADFSPDLFALILRRTSFGFAAEGYGGSARGHVALSNDPRQPGLSSLRIDARDIDLAALPLKDLANLQLAGKLQLKADLPALLPAETTSGSISMSIDGAALNGGSFALPGNPHLTGEANMYAGAPIPLPKAALGHVEGNASVDKGVVHVEKTSAHGGDIDADVDGSLNLRPLLSLSQADLHVRFRPSEKWLNENGMIKGMIGFIQNAKQGDGSYVFTFTGPLTHMQPRPGR